MFRKLGENKKRLRLTIIIVIFIVLIYGAVFPKLIDFLFSIPGTSLTALSHTSASDFLSFWASLLVFGSTVILAFVSVHQNNRLLRLEETKLSPCIIISRQEFTGDSFEKVSISENLGDEIRYFFPNANVEFSFWVKNISDFYISKIVINKIIIMGFVANLEIEPAVVLEYQESISSFFDKAFVPNCERIFTICFENKTNWAFYEMYNCAISCELIHIVGEGSTMQTLNFQVGNNNGVFTIIGTGAFSPNQDLFSKVYS